MFFVRLTAFSVIAIMISMVLRRNLARRRGHDSVPNDFKSQILGWKDAIGRAFAQRPPAPRLNNTGSTLYLKFAVDLLVYGAHMLSYTISCTAAFSQTLIQELLTPLAPTTIKTEAKQE